MHKSIIYLFVLILLVNMDLGASPASVSGIVLDAVTKEPLLYANIEVQGKSRGTVTNSEGRFILDTEDLTLGDTIVFSYIGYETIKIRLEGLMKSGEVLMPQASGLLNEIQIIAQKLSVEEILKKVKENFNKNHRASFDKKHLFFHSYERTPFNKDNQLVLKKSDFVGLDKATFNELFKKIPSEIVEYEDVIVNLYGNGTTYKLIPEKAISLEDGSQKSLLKEFEDKLDTFFSDIEKSRENEDIYYKIRTGILSKKFNNEETDEPTWTTNKNDTLNYTVNTNLVKSEIIYLLKEYTLAESKNWEFINNTRKYNYTMDDITIVDDEPVYKIHFLPQKQGLFEGTMYISTSSFAVLKLDFAFAKGKKSENFKLLGVGHSMNFKEAHIIFQKGKTAYFPKFISVKQNEFASIDRSFSITKKEKRFFIDKELSEMKLDVELSFNSESKWELLVMDAEDIDESAYNRILQPATMKFKKEYAYNSEMWKSRTILVPSSELKKYQNK
ncbi:MAG: carboxypeptidase-like regulatory domain-containing protein [Sporocytophaga sp.]|uniref:carboxypeptidase-like regulatory domain-containing protein n=1 Tax=Sporocytophaga sp. TaxID=2231183 RepID=UPI001B28F0B8|nr:carboxypeptidase-like regulatory domain-containing protein [Sporocytophaga sp.]MBO9700472.1 carboxypeptidase-like regulatory domain-containing protein [Sporocytophaga sp.]